MSSVPFVTRKPTWSEVERLRLVLSTYQDGTGMLAAKGKKGRTLPGWRDFERAVAIAFNGKAPESKWIYDVLIRDAIYLNLYYGVSCKMKEELEKRGKKGEVYIEVTNADGAIWGALNEKGITKQNIDKNPKRAGIVIVQLVESWHANANSYENMLVDTARSIYLCLQYSRSIGEYQLFHYPIGLPNPEYLIWQMQGRSLRGRYDGRIILEYYGYSGSQLKYYPLMSDAVWQSERFKLEPLPDYADDSIRQKVIAYYPDLWEMTNQLLPE